MHPSFIIIPELCILLLNYCRDDTDRRPMPVSLLLSSQVTDIASNISGDPVMIQFQYSTVSAFIMLCT